MKTVKTYQRHCTLLGLVEEKINKKLTKRIEKLSEVHNKKRQGSIIVTLDATVKSPYVK
jgi:hypothetical protein